MKSTLPVFTRDINLENCLKEHNQELSETLKTIEKIYGPVLSFSTTATIDHDSHVLITIILYEDK